MHCTKCGLTLPSDSEFCQYCGEKLNVSSKQSKSASSTIDTTNQTAPLNIENNIQPETENKIPPASPNSIPQCSSHTGKRQNFIRLSRSKLVIIIVFVLAISLVLNIIQFFISAKHTTRLKDLQTTISSQESQIKELENEITNNQYTINSQAQEIHLFENKASYYDEICAELSSGSLGYAANNFKASESIIVISEDTTNRQFTITAHWAYGGTVFVNYSSPAAVVHFDSENWNTTTTLTIEPQIQGITVVTFSNDVDSNRFNVLIVVTD